MEETNQLQLFNLSVNKEGTSIDKGNNSNTIPGINTDNISCYKHQPEPYAPDKVGFGLWDFIIRTPKNSGVTTHFVGIYHNGFIDFLRYHGFYKRFRPDGSYFLLSVCDNMIEEIEPVNIKDFVNGYLEKEGKDISFETNGLKFSVTLLHQKETIKKQCNFFFSKKFLENLPNFEKEILKDTPTECYKMFKNRILKINRLGCELIEYKDLGDKCVWRKHRLDLDFEYTENFKECHFYQFIRNVSNADEEPGRFLAFVSAMGYLLHNYNSPENGQAIILYDESITDINKPEGGTGKGILAKGLSKLSEWVKIDGKKFDADNRFCFQSVKDSTQLVFIDDVNTNLGFDRFNSILTDGWEIEKKNKDEFSIKQEDSPKIIISSNYILEFEGSTRKRRQFILELTDFYSRHIKKGNEAPIKKHHRCTFFSDDWDAKEWQKFYSFLIFCIGEYMKTGLQYYESKNVIANRLRQITNDDFAEWVISQQFELNKVYETKPFYDNFKSTYYPAPIYPRDNDSLSQRKFTAFLKRYASLNDWTFKRPQACGGKTYFKFSTSK